MCGRTCLTLEPNEIACACKYKIAKLHDGSDKIKEVPSNCTIKKNEALQTKTTPAQALKQEQTAVNYVLPEWHTVFNCGRTYAPSYNIAPTDLTPVLVSVDHFRRGSSDTPQEKEQTRVIVPMLWGMIPFWHKGDYRKHGLTTNNCRLEHMLESKLYSGPFRRGQRCVVVCEGMYEWQTTKSAKPSERAAYVLHMPQIEGVQIYDKTTWKPEGIRLLKMAGLFDVWQDEHGEKVYSYTIITFESSKIMSWLHHRMPAILETEQQVNDWLNFKSVTDEQALATLRPATDLKWYRVTNLVNNSRNKSEQCNKPMELVQQQPPQKPPMNKTMRAWLNMRKRREESVKSRDTSDDESIDNFDSASAKAGGSGVSTNTATTSESEAENPPKRPRYRDLKKTAKAQLNTANASTDSASASEKVLATSEHRSSKSNGCDNH